MALQYYTDEMLGENFAALSKFNGDVIDVLSELTNLAERTETRLKSLENIELIVKAPKRSKLFLLTVIGVSAYVGYKYALCEMVKANGERKTQYMERSPYYQSKTKAHEANEDKSDNTTITPEK